MSAQMMVVGYLSKNGRASVFAWPDRTFSVVVNSKLVFDFDSLSAADDFAVDAIGGFDNAAAKLDSQRGW
jgi:hypothetical protein